MNHQIHKELIIKWANGSKIERLHSNSEWKVEVNPTWASEYNYRVMPTKESINTIIFCLPFQHAASSNGLLSVLRFAQTLSVLGIQVIFMCVLSEYPQEELIFTEHLRFRMGDEEFTNLYSNIDNKAKELGINFTTDHESLIKNGATVLYSERIIQNPLNAKKVIRYFGNKDGFLNGGKLVELTNKDFILSHSKVLHPNANHYLYFAEINYEFKNTELKEFNDREASITYVGKGSLYGEVGIFNDTVYVTREFPDNKKELASILRNSRFLFTWDSWTNLIAEAIFCGVVPVILRNEPFTLEEINNSENAPIPCVDISKIEYDEKTKRYNFKNSIYYQNFCIERIFFMNKQRNLELNYPFSVQEFLTKLQVHFAN